VSYHHELQNELGKRKEGGKRLSGNDTTDPEIMKHPLENWKETIRNKKLGGKLIQKEMKKLVKGVEDVSSEGVAWLGWEVKKLR